MSTRTTPDMIASQDADKMQKWITAVLDLVKLTRQGRVSWFMAGSANPQIDSMYIANTEEARFVLTVPRRPKDDREAAGLRGLLTEFDLSRRYPLLAAFSEDGRPLFSFPDIAAIGSLQTAILEQIGTSQEEGILARLHKRAMAEHGVGTDAMSVTKYDENGNRYD